MLITVKPLILASSSPRRQAFLREAGITFDVLAAEIDEQPSDNELPLRYVERMAVEKCYHILLRATRGWLLTADTIVYQEETIFNKPHNVDDAMRILLSLAGKKHQVATSYCLCSPAREIVHTETVVTTVSFSQFDQKLAAAYVKTGEPMDKAGGYGIQGKGGFLVEGIEGSYSNVVGLPVAEVLAVLIKYGIVKTK